MQSDSKTRIQTIALLAATLVLAMGLAGCTSDGTITGAGASFANPVISLYADEYEQQTGERVSYNSIGSGGGIRAHVDKTVHFAASEAPLNAEQEEAARGTLTIPFVIGTVTAAYNLQGVSDLRLSGDVLADIYLAKITRWNDERIVELNPGQNLPDAPITVVHRSDGSGTTYVFTDYLTKISDEWARDVGFATSVSWPTGTGGNGNEGVAGAIRNSPNSIGYIELSYADNVGLPTAAIQNQEGEFITPSLDAGTLAAAGAVENLPASHESWSEVSFTDAPGSGSYPISSFSYYFIYEDLSVLSGAGVDKAFAQRIVDFLAWSITEGQAYNNDVQNARIPESVQRLNLEGLDRVHFGSEPLEVRYNV
jgi:phosphate transport system substrate-binding protein